MPLIYEPTGRAREYAALACNIYKGCAHGCVYCFAPDAIHKTKEEFGKPVRRSATFITDLAKEARQREMTGQTGQILLCFTCDPYQEIDNELKLTRKTIEVLHIYGNRVTVLTKGGTRALRDLGLFGPGDAFATTLTLTDNDDIQKWEPGAATYLDRIQAIRAFHEAGIMTWVSLEPVIYPGDTLAIALDTHRIVDAYKVGTLNHHPWKDMIEWASFARHITDLLNKLGYKRQFNSDELVKGQYYIKNDLARWLE